MPSYDQKQVDAAAARVPRLSSKEVRDLRARAEKADLRDLIAACDAELAARPFDYSQAVAVSFDEMARQVTDMSLIAATRLAFAKVVPPRDYEIRALRWIAANPGGSFQEAEKAYGRGDLSLVIGHLVYDRYGCFRKFIEPGQDQSSVLLEKDRSGRNVCYRLKPEAELVFRELALID